MKPILIVAAAGLVVACAPQEPVELTQSQQTRLAEVLEGRTAGEPVACVSQRDLRGNRSVGDQIIIFEGRGDTLYVNRPAGGCGLLEFGRALRTQTSGVSQLCRGDIVTVFDPVSGSEFGSCGLADFVPYRRAP